MYNSKKFLYEDIAHSFPHDNLLNGYHHYRRLQVALRFLKRIGGNHLVLDAGCGDGIQAEKIVSLHQVVGIDISATRIKRAKKRVKRADFLVGDIFAIPFEENAFSTVVMLAVIEHLKEPQKALREIHRVLADDGFLVLDFPSKSNFIDILLLKLFGIESDWGLYIDRSHVFFYDMEQMKRLLYQSGFDVIDIQGGPWIRWDLPFISKFVWKRKRWPLLEAFDLSFGKLPLIRKYGAVQIFLARKHER